MRIIISIPRATVPLADIHSSPECPVHGNHKLDGAVMYEAAHPHKQYRVCDCGYDDTINEVDLIAMLGLTPIFISCKSGIPNNDAINEIDAIAHRFGSYQAKAFLITACNMERAAPSVKKRAISCNVEIIDCDMLNEDTIIHHFEKIYK